MATWIGIASLVFVAVEAPIYIPILLLGVLVPMLVRIAGVPDAVTTSFLAGLKTLAESSCGRPRTTAARLDTIRCW